MRRVTLFSLLFLSTIALAQSAPPPPAPPQPDPPYPTDPDKRLAVDLMACQLRLYGITKGNPWINPYFIQGFAKSGGKLDVAVMVHADREAKSSAMVDEAATTTRCKQWLAESGPLPPVPAPPTDPIEIVSLDLLACHARLDGWTMRGPYVDRVERLTDNRVASKYSRIADARARSKAMKDDQAVRARCDAMLAKSSTYLQTPDRP